MQVLTADNQLHRVRSFPMAGLDAQQLRAPSSQAIPLGRLPSGETRMLALSRIYRTNPIIYACVHLIARGLSTIPLRTYTLDSDGERTHLRSDLPASGPGRPVAGMALDQLARRPAPRLSRRKLIFKSVVDVGVFGNAIGSFNWGPYGPNELWPIPWRRTVVRLTDPMTILSYDVWGAIGKVTLDPLHVIHWQWGDDPETPMGVSPIEPLQYTIALHNAIDRHLISYYGNSARASGILKMQKLPDAQTVDGIREQFKQLYTAPENAGNVIITSADYQPIAEQTGVPTIVELAKLSRQEILSAYGVDPPMIGIMEQAIKANYQESREKHVLDTLGPWGEMWTSEANSQMVWENPLWAYHWWEFDLQERIRPDMGALATIMQQMQATMTTNERRRFMNLRRLPYAEADTVFPGSGTYPLGIGTPTTVLGPLTPEPDDGSQPIGPDGIPLPPPEADDENLDEDEEDD